MINKGVFLLLIVATFQVYADPFFQKNKLFEGGRFPGLSITNKGTVLAFWGDKQLLVRRSIDKGKTFGRDIVIAKKGINGGGVIVESDGGRILAFSQSKHPPAESFIHESNDDGLTWRTSKLKILNDEGKDQTQLHFSGSGIDLKSIKCQGRIIRPTRVYGTKDGYNNTIYSDNGSQWFSSKGVPIKATGEGAIVELEGGVLLYSSRRHWFPSKEALSPFRVFSKSHDCGETWVDSYESTGLYDGPRYRDLYEGKGPSHQGHYGIMGGMIRFNINGESILLHSSVFDKQYSWLRKGLVIYISLDKGVSWKKSKPLHTGPAAYSDILIIKNNKNMLKSNLIIFFEGGVDKEYEGGYLINTTLENLFQTLNK